MASSILVNVLHLQGFANTYKLNDPSWSVSLEMAAYLLFPIFIHIVSNGPRLASLAFLLAGTLVLAGVAMAHPRLGLAVRYVPLDLVRCFTEFGYGMLVYRMVRARRWMRVIGSDAWTWGVTLRSAATLLLRFDLLAALSFLLVVLAWAWNTGTASRIMSSRIPYFFGVISFSIYLVHHLFRRPELELLRYVWPEPVSPAMALAFAFAGSISVIPAAALAYDCVERPGRTAINLLFKKLRKPARALA